MANSKVSIVTPAFRAERTLKRTVSSVLAQTYADWELMIVADDGVDYERCLSDQGVRDRRIRFVSTDRVGTGPSNARNTGLQAASGAVIALLDADDTFAPEKLALMVPLARKFGLVSSAIHFLEDPTGRPLVNHNRRFDHELLDYEQALFAHLHTYTLLVYDRERIPNRYDPNISRMEDLVFLSGCFDFVDRIYHVPVELHHYYHRRDSLCNEANAASRFISACHEILARLDRGELGVRKLGTRRLLEAFIARQLRLEHRFEAALAAKLCTDFQEFLGRSGEAFSPLAVAA